MASDMSTHMSEEQPYTHVCIQAGAHLQLDEVPAWHRTRRHTRLHTHVYTHACTYVCTDVCTHVYTQVRAHLQLDEVHHLLHDVVEPVQAERDFRFFKKNPAS